MQDFVRCSVVHGGMDDNAECRHIASSCELTSEIFDEILAYLTPPQRLLLARVCRDWRIFVYSSKVWRVWDSGYYGPLLSPSCLLDLASKTYAQVRYMSLATSDWLIPCAADSQMLQACSNLIGARLESHHLERPTIERIVRSSPALTSLSLYGNVASFEICRDIAAFCPYLRELDVSYTADLTDAGLLCIATACQKLRVLKIAGAGSFEEETLAAIRDLPYLEYLCLAKCRVTDKGLRALARGGLGLRKLDLSSCSLVTLQGISELAHQVPYLESLDLSVLLQSRKQNLDCLTEFLQSVPTLRELNLEQAGFVTDNVIRDTGDEALTELRCLGLSFCQRITDDLVVYLLRHCQHLERIDLDNTSVTDAVVAAAIDCSRVRPRALPPLRIMLYDCPHVTWHAVEDVMTHNLKCCTLSSWVGRMVFLKASPDMQTDFARHYDLLLEKRYQEAAAAAETFSCKHMRNDVLTADEQNLPDQRGLVWQAPPARLRSCIVM